MVTKRIADKVFTRYLGGQLAGCLPTVATPPEVIDSFQVEEDIYIVGWSINVLCHITAENDGRTHGVGSLSTAFPLGFTGLLGQAHANEEWNTIPAFGYNNPGRHVVILASENYIEVKEEGYVYAVLSAECAYKTAGNTGYYIDAAIYYVKKKG